MDKSEPLFLLPSEITNKELIHLEKLGNKTIKAKAFVIKLRLKYATKKIKNYG